MTAAVNRFVQTLVMECEDTESTAFVDALLVAAKTKISAGDGTVGALQSATVNGKSFTQQQTLTADEVMYACRQALRQYANTAGTQPFTFLDFSSSQMNRL